MSQLLADFATLGPKVNTLIGPLKVQSSPSVVLKPTCNVFLGSCCLDRSGFQLEHAEQCTHGLTLRIHANGGVSSLRTPEAGAPVAVAYFGLDG